MIDTKIEGKLANILREATGNPRLEVGMDTPLRGILGWDSVSLVTAMLLIEDEFGIEFEANGFVSLETVDDVLRLIEKMRS